MAREKPFLKPLDRCAQIGVITAPRVFSGLRRYCKTSEQFHEKTLGKNGTPRERSSPLLLWRALIRKEIWQS